MKFLKQHWIWIAAIGAVVYFNWASAVVADANARADNFKPGGGGNPAGGATGAW